MDHPSQGNQHSAAAPPHQERPPVPEVAQGHLVADVRFIHLDETVGVAPLEVEAGLDTNNAIYKT